MQDHQKTEKRSRLKLLITVTILFMMSGTIIELFLLKHFEDTKQMIPIICIALSMLMMLILIFRNNKILVKGFQILMLISALTGLYGSYLHLSANYEFELEMRPSMKGWELFAESMTGAFPTLAPGSMIVLALLGYTYSIIIKQQR